MGDQRRAGYSGGITQKLSFKLDGTEEKRSPIPFTSPVIGQAMGVELRGLGSNRTSSVSRGAIGILGAKPLSPASVGGEYLRTLCLTSRPEAIS